MAVAFVLDGLNQARIMSPRPDTLTRFETGHMRRMSLGAWPSRLARRHDLGCCGETRGERMVRDRALILTAA